MVRAVLLELRRLMIDKIKKVSGDTAKVGLTNALKCTKVAGMMKESAAADVETQLFHYYIMRCGGWYHQGYQNPVARKYESI